MDAGPRRFAVGMISKTARIRHVSSACLRTGCEDTSKHACLQVDASALELRTALERLERSDAIERRLDGIGAQLLGGDDDAAGVPHESLDGRLDSIEEAGRRLRQARGRPATTLYAASMGAKPSSERGTEC